MKNIKVTIPQKDSDAQIVALVCGFSNKKIAGKVPITFVRLKLSAPINGDTSLSFSSGEPGFDDLAKALDIEKAISAAVAKRFPNAEIKDLPIENAEPKKKRSD